jgi:hypothetical protein
MRLASPIVVANLQSNAAVEPCKQGYWLAAHIGKWNYWCVANLRVIKRLEYTKITEQLNQDCLTSPQRCCAFGRRCESS